MPRPRVVKGEFMPAVFRFEFPPSTRSGRPGEGIGNSLSPVRENRAFGALVGPVKRRVLGQKWLGPGATRPSRKRPYGKQELDD